MKYCIALIENILSADNLHPNFCSEGSEKLVARIEGYMCGLLDQVQCLKNPYLNFFCIARYPFTRELESQTRKLCPSKLSLQWKTVLMASTKNSPQSKHLRCNFKISILSDQIYQSIFQIFQLPNDTT